MKTDFYKFKKKYTISKIVIGEDDLTKENKKSNGFFYCLLILVMLAIIILFSNRCIKSINTKFILNIVFIGSVLLILIIWFWLICSYRKNRIKIIQEKIPEYKPDLILGGMINKTLFKGIDWGNYYIKLYWFEQLEIRCHNISTKDINCHLNLIKYDLLDKPRLDYSTLIGVIAVIISFISLINLPVRAFFYIGEIETKEDLFYYIMLWTIIFITISAMIKLFVDIKKQNYREMLDKYEENLKWCQAFEYISNRRKKNKSIFTKVINKIIGI